MPIFDVEVVRREGERLPEALAAGLAEALGAVMGAAPGKVWVRLRELAPERYAENGAGPARPSPAFVTLLASAAPEGDRLAERVAGITAEVARLTGRDPENVHVLVEASARGRIAFGGRVVR